MRSIIVAFCAVLWFLIASANAAPPVTSYHLVLARRALAAGESVDLKLVPPPPSGTNAYWRAGADMEMVDLSQPIYRAPYMIPIGAPSVALRADLSGPEVGRISVQTTIDLIPGAIPGSDECLGPGQSFSTTYGDVLPHRDYVRRVEGLVVRIADAEYPKAAVTRELIDTVVVRALLCRTGRVLDAYLETAYGDDWEPVEYEAVLADAAPAIVRGHVFEPVTEAGEAIAAWIHVHVAFRP